MHRYLDFPNDEFLPIDFVIGVNLYIPIEYDLTMYRFGNFGVDESWLVYSTNVMYTIEHFTVYDTCI